MGEPREGARLVLLHRGSQATGGFAFDAMLLKVTLKSAVSRVRDGERVALNFFFGATT
jgi:hypothetical protein